MRSRGTETKAAVKSKINVRKARDASIQRRMGPGAVCLPAFLECHRANVTGGPSRPHAPSPHVRSSSLGSFGPASGNLQAFPFVTKVTVNKVVRS